MLFPNNVWSCIYVLYHSSLNYVLFRFILAAKCNATHAHLLLLFCFFKIYSAAKDVTGYYIYLLLLGRSEFVYNLKSFSIFSI